MIANPQDTIVALSSAAGPGGRAIVRLSGSDAFRLATSVCQSRQPIGAAERRSYPVELSLPNVSALLPADLYIWPPPRTYTGQEMVEIHTFSCPPLVDLLIAQLLSAGARAAQPGEFTLRAFLSGKLDLTRAEAVLAVIHAGDRKELKQALEQLAGGMARPLQELRDELLNFLADVEAGLDFADEDIEFVDRNELLNRLDQGLAQLVLLRQQLDQRGLSDRHFRVVLAGRPNAGKSSLFNALAEETAALVSPVPGTTRDYLVRRLDLGDVPIELVDTAGRQDSASTLEQQAQALGREQAREADLLVLCVPAGATLDDAEEKLLSGSSEVIAVTTKSDLAPAPPERIATSALTGTGLDELRASLAQAARRHLQPALATSVSRCRHHVDACCIHLQAARQMVRDGESPELVALELRGALNDLGEMVGAVYTDDLLDRIFSRFCIGK